MILNSREKPLSLVLSIRALSAYLVQLLSLFTLTITPCFLAGDDNKKLLGRCTQLPAV